MVNTHVGRQLSGDSANIAGSLPMLNIANTTRNNIVAVLGEFVGTFMFLFFSFAGTQVANTPPGAPGSDPNLPSIIFIALSFGVSLTANVWAFYRVTGGMFNPVVTLALTICGGLPPLRALLIMPTQIIAGLCAAGVASAMFPGPLSVTTALGGGTKTAQGFFIEVILTAQLVFVILMLAVEKHRSTFLAPVGIGLSFFLAELTGVYFTGGSLNPARSFGPAAVDGIFPHYHWIYWLGPVVGSLIACGFYLLLRNLRYYECNPGQDDDGHETNSERSFKP
ncbi:MIP family channel protein [Colletotrichum orchidophilum]|uniref:MIP family channel protein n=1 Tax=Colletotrichum orchidophilum TaxID=1209926 RepID=A0A1G4B1K7_9PEZI|nr:MIP family channel protein [Colletotrichum orchidophilum]OHE95192.1 MIP family channel protein [Colletotrichum orchidophilum]